jgi:hypothetical protein
LKKIISILAAIAMIMAISGCSMAKTDPNTQGLHYKGGALTATKYANCYGPSTRQYDGPGDKHYNLPYGLRTFSFTGRGGAESKPIKVTDSSGQELDIPGYVTLTLTNDCDKVREWFERIGLKYHAYTGGRDSAADMPEGFKNFLVDYLETPIQQSMNHAAQDVEGGWKDIYTNTAVQQQFEQDVKSELPSLLNQALGGDYIKINSIQITKPIIDSSLTEAITSRNVAEQDNKAQAERNKKILTQFQTIKDCLDTGLDKQSCTLIYLQQSGADIPFLPVPQGGSINFNGTGTR